LRAASSVPDEPPPSYEASVPSIQADLTADRRCTKGEKSRTHDGVARNSDSKAPPTSFAGGDSLIQDVQDASPIESFNSRSNTAMEFCIAAKGKLIATEAEWEKRFKSAVWGSPDYWKGYEMKDEARKAHNKAEETLRDTFQSAIRAGMTLKDANKMFNEGSHTAKWARDAVLPVWSLAQEAVDKAVVVGEFGDDLG
jgi:hypothetical protein